jgi:hypothetical protein
MKKCDSINMAADRGGLERVQGILGLRTISKSTLSLSRGEKPVLLSSGQSSFPYFTGTELPTDGIDMAHEPLEDIAPQSIDILH